MYLARANVTVREDGRQRQVHYCVERELPGDAVIALAKRLVHEVESSSLFTNDLYPIALSGRIEVALVAH
jgi:hypothetical protein